MGLVFFLPTLFCLVFAQEIPDLSPVSSPFIVNGEDAEPGEFPFMVMVLDKVNGQYYRGECGGSFIHDDLVLTATHCIKGRETKNDAVYVNAHSPYNNNGGQKMVVLDVAEQIIHPSYTFKDIENDVAILRLKDTVQNAMAKKYGEPFRNSIRPIKLAPFDNIKESILTVIGFGKLASGGNSNILQKVNVKYVSNKDCDKKYGKGLIKDDMMCASDGNKDACQGDSGGPLMKRTAGVYEQVGVVSWGYGCGEKHPGVYARVQTNLSWLKTNGCRNSLKPSTGYCR